MKAAITALLLISGQAQAEVCVASKYNTHETKWGTQTASGIPLDDNVPSMAHSSYPLLGFVSVTNLRTRKSIVLQVIDRMPRRIDNRCADLSEAANKILGLNGLGYIEVQPIWRE